MRAHEIIQGYIDPTKMPAAMYNEIVDAFERIGADPASSAFIKVMYGDRRGELELEQLQLDLYQTRAEIKRLEAEAARDLANIQCELTSESNSIE